MKKKPTIGIVIFAWAVILIALIEIASLFDPAAYAKAYLKPWGTIFYVASFPFIALEIVLGVQVLRLKEWARKGLVLVTAFYAVTLIMMPFVMDEETVVRDLEIATQQIMDDCMSKIPPEQQQEFARTMTLLPRALVRLLKWIYIALSMAFYLGTIIFFTRPKVQAQFTVQNSSGP